MTFVKKKLTVLKKKVLGGICESICHSLSQMSVRFSTQAMTVNAKIEKICRHCGPQLKGLKTMWD